MPSSAQPVPRDLEILAATYAAHDNAGQKNIADKVRDLCRRDTDACTVPCDNVTYGDPASGHAKFCEIVYRCAAEHKTRTARSEENTAVVMTCRGCP